MAKKKANLDLEGFNDILVNTGGIDEKDLLIHEIQFAYAQKIQAMEELVRRLNGHGPEKRVKETLDTVNNIDGNLDLMARRLDALNAEGKDRDEA